MIWRREYTLTNCIVIKRIVKTRFTNGPGFEPPRGLTQGPSQSCAPSREISEVRPLAGRYRSVRTAASACCRDAAFTLSRAASAFVARGALRSRMARGPQRFGARLLTSCTLGFRVGSIRVDLTRVASRGVGCDSNIDVHGLAADWRAVLPTQRSADPSARRILRFTRHGRVRPRRALFRLAA